MSLLDRFGAERQESRFTENVHLHPDVAGLVEYQTVHGSADDLEGMDTETAGLLAEKGITSRDALADLAVDELVELTALSPERSQELIMKARAHWFEDAQAE